MIHKIYTLQLISLFIGILFLIISIYTLFRHIKRDKIIAISVFTICLLVFLISESLIMSYNKQAVKYIGIYELKNYNNSKDFKIEILPQNEYIIFNNTDTVKKGKWMFRKSKDNLEVLMIDNNIFGLNELEIK